MILTGERMQNAPATNVLRSPMVVFRELDGWEWLVNEVAVTAKGLAGAAEEVSERDWNRWVENSSRKR